MFISKGQVDIKIALAQVMAWRTLAQLCYAIWCH